jgi:membrane-bound lytic murein transglycosylase D
LILRILLFIAFLFVQSHAFLTTNNNFPEKIKVLKSFDIDEGFLTDPTFLSMKEDIDRYRTEHFLKVLENGYKFIPILRDMLSQSSVPDAFLYMAMAESNFSVRAYSRKRAVGLWQFMPYTAKKFGLTVDLYMDERRDPIRSTQAAIDYLLYLHDKFGKWYLAALAYNCGEGRLSRAIKKAGTDDLSVLLERKKRYIPRESRIYIRKILLMAFLSSDRSMMLENEVDHLLNGGGVSKIAAVGVAGGTLLGDVAQSIGVSEKELKSLNVHLRYNFFPPSKKEYTLYIPYDKIAEFKNSYDPSKSNNQFLVHVVQKGDSLYAIGKKYNMPYSVIKDFNNLKSNFLSLNQKLIIPKIGKANIKMPKSKRNYTIKSGDTLSEISRKFGIEIKKLMQANNMTNYFIKKGDTLVIPYN